MSALGPSSLRYAARVAGAPARPLRSASEFGRMPDSPIAPGRPSLLTGSAICWERDWSAIALSRERTSFWSGRLASSSAASPPILGSPRPPLLASAAGHARGAGAPVHLAGGDLGRAQLPRYHSLRDQPAINSYAVCSPSRNQVGCKTQPRPLDLFVDRFKSLKYLAPSAHAGLRRICSSSGGESARAFQRSQ